MVGDVLALGSFSLTVLGTAWKLNRHFDERLDRMELERSVIVSQVRILEHRVGALEQRLFEREEARG